MSEAELQTIITEELAARPIFAPANVKAYLNLIYRDLAALPAAEVRRAVQDFYRAHQVNRWPQPDEIRAQIPRAVVERAVANPSGRPDPNCMACDGTGWRYVGTRHAGDLDEAVTPCACRKGAAA